MSQGELVPDEITIGMVRERLQQPDCQNGRHVRWFPAHRRSRPPRWITLLNELGGKVNLVIDFELPIEISRQRLMGRQEGRADDKPEVIEKRLNDHATVEASVMPHYHASRVWSKP